MGRAYILSPPQLLRSCALILIVRMEYSYHFLTVADDEGTSEPLQQSTNVCPLPVCSPAWDDGLAGEGAVGDDKQILDEGRPYEGLESTAADAAEEGNAEETDDGYDSRREHWKFGEGGPEICLS